MARFIVRRKLGPLLQLLGDVLGHQLGVDLGAIHFHRLDFDVAVGQVFESLVSLSTSWPFLPMIMPTRAEWMIDHHLLAGPLDADLGDAGACR